MDAVLPRPSAVLMGPQRMTPIVDRALDLLAVTGKVAVITAGWQEREEEDDELQDALGGPRGSHLLTQVYDSASRRSDFAIFEAAAIERGPVARVRLRHHVPLSFHGFRRGG